MSTNALIKVSPHTIPGTLHQQNQAAFDWGLQGLIAYGCHSTVVVIEPKSVQPLQTLSHHKTNIIKVRWAPSNHHHSINSPYSLKLASVDHSSQCVIWDVTQGTVSTEFSLGTRQLVDLQWLTMNDSCRDLLAVLLTPSTMTIWNTDTGTKVSRFTFIETILGFAFDPFKAETLVLQSPDCFIFINEFNPGRNPSNGGKKFYMTAGDHSAMPLPGRVKTPVHLQRRLVSGDQLRGEETLHLSDCVQMLFSPSHRHHLFVVYPREVAIMDTDIHQTVGVITLDRNASPFSRLLPCMQRDMIFCLHENGCVSVRVQKAVNPSSVDTPLSPVGQSDSREVKYVIHGLSEPLRISKSCHVFTGAVCPTTEKQVAILTSEGRILFWECEFEQLGLYGQELPKEAELYPSFITARPVRGVDLVTTAQEDEGYGGGGQDEGSGITLADTIAPHWFTPPEGCTSNFGLLSLKLTLGKLWAGISGIPKTVRMCPPLTTRNWLIYAPLLAVGTSNGSVLIFNLAKRVLTKEFSVHSCPVYGIEWVGHTSFVSYAYTNPNTSGNVRNEVAITDIRTGKMTYLKRPDVAENSYQTPIDCIKISQHRHYLTVKYINRPLEFYDVKTFAFLRELVSNPPSFSCVEWSPNHHRSKAPKVDPLTLGMSTSAVDFDLAMGASDSRTSQTSGREMLTVMDDNGSMWQISIDGSKIKVVNSAPTQTWLNNPACVTWKGDLMVAGDVNGVLIFYDSKVQQARTAETPRAAVKKIRFAPGKGNTKLLVLYTSRLDIRDAHSDAVLSQMKWGPRDGDRAIEDCDWATSDKVVLLTSDSCVRVFDVSLKCCQSAIDTTDFAVPVFCPHAVPPVSSLRLKCLLQHQPWKLEYNLDHEDLSPDNAVEKAIKEQIETVPDEYCRALLESKLGTAERCLLTASLYGDQREVAFWTVALYYMLRERNRRQDPQYNAYEQSHHRNPSSDFIRPDSDASISIGGTSQHKTPSLDDLLGPINSDAGIDSEGESLPSHQTPPTFSLDLGPPDVTEMLHDAELKTLTDTPPLDLCYDLLCDSKTFKRMQLDRVLLHDSRRQTYDQTRKCAETLMLLGQTDRAVQMLLETDSSSDNYYTDALRACLAATIRSSGASQSTIKLVATNLIANSRLFEGVQLLCLIDKGQDSCRYLQTYGEWYQSVWLAKATLNEKDSKDVFGRWAEHLASVGVNQKNKAVLVYLSLGHFYKVIEMLYSMRCFDQAALFAESCLEYNLIDQTRTTTPLLEAVFLEYARYLHSLHLKRGARHYCNKAGEKGGQLLEQWMPSSKTLRVL